MAIGGCAPMNVPTESSGETGLLRPPDARPPLKPVIFLLGTGGVGKTTCSLALAHALSRTGKRIALLTVDPARRLEKLMVTLSDSSPELTIVKTDVKELFPGFVERHAPEAQTASAILDSRFFPHLSDRLQALHEYVSADLIRELIESKSYDHIVVDTPPFAYALHFLEAPRRLRQLADIAGVVFSAGAKGGGAVRSLPPVLTRGLSYFLGKSFLMELIDFVAAFARLWAELDKSTRAAEEIFHHQASFGVAYRADSRSVDDLLAFLKQRPDWLSVSFLAANKLMPGPPDLAARLVGLSVGDIVAELQAEPSCRLWKPGLHDSAARSLLGLTRAACAAHTSQTAALARVESAAPDVASVYTARLPLLPGGIQSGRDLDRLARAFGPVISEFDP
jgi:anion-transporting  ArsA/GET3 family ATPase